MTTQDPVREALTIAIEALDSIALAGMSGTGQESEEAMQAWHARRAWEFIRIAARAKDDVRAALTKPDAGEVELSREGLIDDIMDRVQLFGDAMARRIANSSPGAPGAAWQAAYNEAKRLKDEIRCQLRASPAPLAAGGCQPDGLMFDAFGEPRTRYVRVTLDGSHCVMHPSEGDRYLQDARDSGDSDVDRYVVRDVYLSEREIDDLPEFDGF